MTEAQAKKLREAFPASVIGKIPKGGVELDYVGHAAVTDRLLAVDPTWTWEPLALSPEGLPALDRAGNLWIKLTICGVTRLGVGDGKSAKECIGDAIRNAAMRFGVALDLWAKQDLHEISADQKTPPDKPASAGAAGSAPAGDEPPGAPPPSDPVGEAALLVLVGEGHGDLPAVKESIETARKDPEKFAAWLKFQKDWWTAHVEELKKATA